MINIIMLNLSYLEVTIDMYDITSKELNTRLKMGYIYIYIFLLIIDVLTLI